MKKFIKPFMLLTAVLTFSLSCRQEVYQPGSTNENAEPINLKSTNSENPNILLIITDDMGVDATPGYDEGTTKPNMPNLQALASNGIRFDNVWSYPVCSPTRATILTGKYGFRTGVLDPTTNSNISPTEKSLHAYLDEVTGSAYSHSLIGKWHLSNDASVTEQLGIGYYAGLLSGTVSDYYNWSLTENGQTSTSNEYITTKITDLAIDWINQQDKPWFCWLAYNSPHNPLHEPPFEMHSQGDLPGNRRHIRRNPMTYFMAMIESVDYEIGRLMESIPESELENTIIIFLGDNGTTRNVIQAPFTSDRGKNTLYQGGINVPMFISGPGIRTNASDNSLISTADLFATIAELAGADVDTYEDSYSFKSLLTSTGGNTLRNYNYSESTTAFTIRDSRYKLIRFDGEDEFYDLVNDPYEETNLLNGTLSAAQQEIYEDLINESDRIRQ